MRRPRRPKGRISRVAMKRARHSAGGGRWEKRLRGWSDILGQFGLGWVEVSKCCDVKGIDSISLRARLCTFNWE